ncbi:MAG: hypothetical protein ACKOXB_06270 [Flavobacteriales bacterium]
MLYYQIFFVVMCALLLLATFLERDFFPFSNYPMFSRPAKAENITILRIKLEKENGEINWWQPEFFRYPEKINQTFNEIQKLKKNSGNNILVQHEENKIIAEILRLIKEEEGSVNYKALHLIERKIQKNISINDDTVAVFPLDRLKKENGF